MFEELEEFVLDETTAGVINTLNVSSHFCVTRDLQTSQKPVTGADDESRVDVLGDDVTDIDTQEGSLQQDAIL